MGHYIIVDRQATFAIAVQDALEEGGHSAEIFEDPQQALDSLVDYGADVLILDLGIASNRADEKKLVGTFHNLPETISLPIVGLAERMDSEYVIEILKFGLTDVLPRRLPLDELILRITRSTGQPTAKLPMFQGRLAENQLIDFLEYLRHIGKSGVVQVTSPGGAGRIHISRGAVSDARFKDLRGQAAVLAMLDQNSGKFKLGAGADNGESDQAKGIDMQWVLLRATWLADKLAEYRDWVPRSGHELELVALPVREVPDDADNSLPFKPILDLAQAREFVRLHDLQREIGAPPQELRLALAILCKMGSLRLREQEQAPSTQELSSSLGIEYSILDLLQRARQKGHTGRTLSLLLFAEPDVWESLKELFLKLTTPPFDAFAATLQSLDRGSVTLDSEAGKLVLHVYRLDPRMPGNAKTVISACDGLLLWLGSHSDTDLLTELVQRVRNTRNAIRGVVVTSDPKAMEWSRQALEFRPEWTLSFRPPSRLTSLLRCFYSQARESPSMPTGGS